MVLLEVIVLSRESPMPQNPAEIPFLTVFPLVSEVFQVVDEEPVTLVSVLARPHLIW